MRRVLVLLVAAALVGHAGSSALDVAHAQSRSRRSSALELDSARYAEDEPIWACLRDVAAPAHPTLLLGGTWTLAGRLENGDSLRWEARPPAAGRAGEIVHGLGIAPRGDRFPLLALQGAPSGGLAAGRYEVRYTGPDGTRASDRFQVYAPKGEEARVRIVLARASRLRRKLERPVEAARLYEAVLTRYPRNAYLSLVYLELWDLRAHTKYRDRPGRWLEEVFARFHDSCFAVIAIDRYVQGEGLERALPVLGRLAALYPGTRAARAAALYRE